MPRGISRIERIFEPIRILLEKGFYHPRIYPRTSRDRRGGALLSKYVGTEAREEGEEDESALANTSSSEW